MESLRNEPIMMGGFPGTGGSGYGDGLGGGLGLIALLALLGGKGGNNGLFGGNNGGGGTAAVEGLVSNIEISDIKQEIGELRGSIKNTALEQTIAQNANFSNITNRIFDGEKETLKRGFQDEIKLLEVENKLSNKISAETLGITNKLFGLEVEMDKKFCALSHEMEKGFYKLEERELKEENRDLRDKIAQQSQYNQTALLLQAIQGVGRNCAVSSLYGGTNGISTRSSNNETIIGTGNTVTGTSSSVI